MPTSSRPPRSELPPLPRGDLHVYFQWVCWVLSSLVVAICKGFFLTLFYFILLITHFFSQARNTPRVKDKLSAKNLIHSDLPTTRFAIFNLHASKNAAGLVQIVDKLNHFHTGSITMGPESMQRMTGIQTRESIWIETELSSTSLIHKKSFLRSPGGLLKSLPQNISLLLTWG